MFSKYFFVCFAPILFHSGICPTSSNANNTYSFAFGYKQFACKKSGPEKGQNNKQVSNLFSRKSVLIQLVILSNLFNAILEKSLLISSLNSVQNSSFMSIIESKYDLFLPDINSAKLVCSVSTIIIFQKFQYGLLMI